MAMNSKSLAKLSFLAIAVSVAISLATSQATAGTVTLTFGDLRNGVDINNWFDGGTNPFPPGQTGPADGVVFSQNANEQKAGVTGSGGQGTGKFENNPSGVNGVLFFAFSSSALNGNTASYLNDAAGFTQLSFDFSYLNNLATNPETVQLYSGLNGTGTLLASLTLSPSGTTVPCTTNARDEFCTWSLATLNNFAGVAQSALFGGPSSVPLEGIEFDDVVLTPTPLPAALPLFVGGLSAMGLLLRRRKPRNGLSP